MTDKLEANNFSPAVFPADILYDENLDSSERLILLILFTYTNAHTNSAFPSYQTLADRAAINRRSVIRIIERLVLKGYIVKQKQYRETKTKGKIEQTSNLFKLYYHERKNEKSSDLVEFPKKIKRNTKSDKYEKFYL